jgi:hypothetical protein
MNREQIRRAERVSETLLARRMRTIESLQEAKQWQRPRSTSGTKQHDLQTKRGEYTFTDEQFRIALASLEKAEQ